MDTRQSQKVLLLVGVQPQKRVLLRIVQVKQLLRLPQKRLQQRVLQIRHPQKLHRKKLQKVQQKITSKNKVSYVINEDTGKFHLSTCRFVKQMNEENKVISSKSRDILIKEGYEACKVCKP